MAPFNCRRPSDAQLLPTIGSPSPRQSALLGVPDPRQNPVFAVHPRVGLRYRARPGVLRHGHPLDLRQLRRPRRPDSSQQATISWAGTWNWAADWSVAPTWPHATLTVYKTVIMVR